MLTVVTPVLGREDGNIANAEGESNDAPSVKEPSNLHPTVAIVRNLEPAPPGALAADDESLIHRVLSFAVNVREDEENSKVEKAVPINVKLTEPVVGTLTTKPMDQTLRKSKVTASVMESIFRPVDKHTFTVPKTATGVRHEIVDSEPHRVDGLDVKPMRTIKVARFIPCPDSTCTPQTGLDGGTFDPSLPKTRSLPHVTASCNKQSLPSKRGLLDEHA
jgi:hypothetical protein